MTDTHTPDHDATTCPGCRELEEYRVTADVYGCPAGRRCTQATPEQRAEFDRQIAKRLTARRQNSPEKS